MRRGSDTYLDALAELLSSLTLEQLAAQRRSSQPASAATFDRTEQQRRACKFIADILAASTPPRERRAGRR